MCISDTLAYFADADAPIMKLWVAQKCVSRLSLLMMFLKADVKLILVSIVLSDRINSGPGCFPLIVRYNKTDCTEHTLDKSILGMCMCRFLVCHDAFDSLMCKCTTYGVCLLSNGTSDNYRWALGSYLPSNGTVNRLTWRKPRKAVQQTACINVLW